MRRPLALGWWVRLERSSGKEKTMRRRFLLVFTAAIIVGIASPAWAQSSDESDSRDRGGLHVSGGGVFGYVGGSGSPSGTITGPGGARRSQAAAGVSAPVRDPMPSAVQGGVVSKAPLPVQPEAEVEAEPAASVRLSPLTWLIAALMLAGFVWLYRKLPKAS